MAQFDCTRTGGHHGISLFCSGIIAAPNPVAPMVDVRQWVGGGFHTPSVALAVAMTLRFVVSDKIPRAVVERHEHILRERTHGTVLWHGVVALFVIELVSKTQPMSSLMCRSNYHLWTKSLPWAGVRRLLHKVPFYKLHVFGAWAVDQGRDGFVLDPDWAFQCHSPVLWAAGGRQKTRGARRGMAHVIRPGLGPELELRSGCLICSMDHGESGPSNHAWRHWQLRISPCSGVLVRSMPLTCVKKLRSGHCAHCGNGSPSMARSNVGRVFL